MPKVAAAQVVEAPVVPRGAQRLGYVSVRCSPVTPGESFRDRSLVDVDCSRERLLGHLRQAAAEYGGDVLAEVECDSYAGVRCRATLGRFAGDTPAPNLERPNDELWAAGIWVSFAASVAELEPPVRRREEVRELAELGPSLVPVGALEAHCEGCAERDLREALLISAGRLGITGVVGVRCRTDDSEERCQAEAAVLEADLLR